MANSRRIAPGGTRGTLFQAVARIRLKDADILLKEQRHEGALYLAGYAIECILKWGVTRRRDVVRLPAELETHDWDTLLSETGPKRFLEAEPAMHTMYSELAERWGPELRYLAKLPRPEEADAALWLDRRSRVMSTETKVKKLVKDVLPKGKTFRLSWQPVGFGSYRVLRVITPAWRSLPRFQRILKLQAAITNGLAPQERADILRVSVLTADEYKQLHPALLYSRPLRTRIRRHPANGK